MKQPHPRKRRRTKRTKMRGGDRLIIKLPPGCGYRVVRVTGCPLIVVEHQKGAS